MLARIVRQSRFIAIRGFSSGFSPVESFVGRAFESAGLSSADAKDDIEKLKNAKILNHDLLLSLSSEDFKEIGVSLGGAKCITAALSSADRPNLQRSPSRGGQALDGRTMGSM